MKHYKNTSSEVKHVQESGRCVYPVHINQELVREVEDGNISVMEAFLLGIVDSLVKCKDVGCFATNADIGRRMGGKTANHIGDMISDLVKRGYIVDRGWFIFNNEKRRVIETYYYKAQRKNKNIYGKINREVASKKDEETGQFLGSKNKQIRKNPEGGIPGKSRERFPEKAGNPIPGKSRDIDKTYYLDKTKEGKKTSEQPASRPCSSSNRSSFPDSKTTSKQQQDNIRWDAARQSDEDSTRSNSIEQKPVRDSSTKRIDKGKDTYENEYDKAAVDLRNGFIKANRLSSKFNKKEWSNVFRLLHTKDGCKDWKEITYFAIKHLAISDINDLKLPSFTDPSALRKPQIYDWLSKVYYHQKKLKQSFYNENFYTSPEQAEMDKLGDHEV